MKFLSERWFRHPTAWSKNTLNQLRIQNIDNKIQAQYKVKEKDILGQWHYSFDTEELYFSKEVAQIMHCDEKISINQFTELNQVAVHGGIFAFIQKILSVCKKNNAEYIDLSVETGNSSRRHLRMFFQVSYQNRKPIGINGSIAALKNHQKSNNGTNTIDLKAPIAPSAEKYESKIKSFKNATISSQAKPMLKLDNETYDRCFGVSDNHQNSPLALQDKQTEENRERELPSQGAYKRVSSVSDIGIWEWDKHTGKIWFSTNVSEVFEVDIDSNEGFVNFLTYTVHPDQRVSVMHSVDDFLAGDTDLDIECMLRVKKAYKWFRIHSNENPTCVDNTSILGIIIDINNEKTLQVDACMQAWRFEEFARFVPEVFWDFSIENQYFTYISPAFSSIWQMPLSSDSTLTLDWWMNTIIEIDRERTLRQYQYAIESCDSISIEYRVLTSKGLRWIDSRCSPIVDKQGKVSRLIGIASDVTDRVHTLSKLSEVSDYDRLTGIPNRHAFLNQLKYCLEVKNSYFALLFLHVNRFIKLNKTFGHSVGDEVLKQCTARILNIQKQSSVVGRTGGDEFAIIYNIKDDPDTLHDFIEELISGFKTPIKVGNHKIYISISIGASRFKSGNTSVHEVLTLTDIAVKKAKASRSNEYEILDYELEDLSVDGFHLESELCNAIDNNEYVLYYQPKVCSQTNTITGCEALIRWKHPIKGIVPPNEFIPVLEKTRLIYRVGDWILRESLTTLAQWQHEGFENFCMSINVSSVQLNDKGFYQKLSDLIKELNIDPKYIEIELTESTMISDPDYTCRLIDRLKSIGVKLAIDDFGTGYSFLYYLERFRPNTVKIDRSFIHDILKNEFSRTLVTAIINMCHELQIDVVAEGVEDAGQVELLKSAKCEHLQGFHFSKALKKENFFSYYNEFK